MAKTQTSEYCDGSDGEDEDKPQLSNEDWYLLEAASRALKEAARIIGSWRDYKDSAQTFLAVQARIDKRMKDK